MGRLRAFVTLFTAATVVYAWRNKRSHGTFAKVPYDFRRPTFRKIKEHLWNPDDPRLVTPHAFGVGWGVNAYQLMKRLGRLRGRGEEKEAESPEETEG